MLRLVTIDRADIRRRAQRRASSVSYFTMDITPKKKREVDKKSMCEPRHKHTSTLGLVHLGTGTSTYWTTRDQPAKAMVRYATQAQCYVANIISSKDKAV
jgi:hypothetical protein